MIGRVVTTALATAATMVVLAPVPTFAAPVAAPTTSPASSSLPAAGCYGSSCEGKDPQAMGCGADATTLVGISDGLNYYELRRSWACYAAWVRVTSPRVDCNEACNNSAWGQVLRYTCDKATRDCLASIQSAQAIPGDGGTSWSNMANFWRRVRVCHNHRDGRALPESRHCSRAF